MPTNTATATGADRVAALRAETRPPRRARRGRHPCGTTRRWWNHRVVDAVRELGGTYPAPTYVTEGGS
ncbi:MULTISPECIES: hypothetical protein [unclassified Amycolatopsis]|uniref:hypothetical protein n=1 Tax=unclassified Amycolatopsis TaxID=2618356 RepID=UPI001C698337|nr:hypothetical protein [Amycolatopsis sp. DSM 110486]QYN17815.1 hypothetical protein K1T34_34275 [Amycolatopsis sp. DSM 110486]